MKKIILSILTSLNLMAYDFGEDVNIVGKWEVETETKQFIRFLTTAGNKWDLEFKDDGFIYDAKTGEFEQNKWSYSRENGIIEIQYYTNGKEADQKMNAIFTNLTNDRIKIIKKIDPNIYLVEILENNVKLIMKRVGESEKTKNTKIKKSIIIEMK